MYQYLIELINNKRILILGFGKEGKSTYNLLNKFNNYKSLAISDLNLIENINVDKIYHGSNYLDCINDYDIVFKSPGIALFDKQYDAYITSQSEIFIKIYQKQIIGITGTKGKSTISTLLYHVLINNNKDVLLVGNIGLPFFDIIDDIKLDTIIICELGCHQLENIKYSPHISVISNIYQDHLDHYLSFDHYIKAKCNIYIHQNPCDYLIINHTTKNIIKDINSKCILFDQTNITDRIKDILDNHKLKGKHNQLNALIVLYICNLLNIDIDNFYNNLKTYQPLSHRIEFIGNYNNIDYYDDSISTTAESTIAAINSIDNLDTIILGGLDRNINYQLLIDTLLSSNINNIILIYASGLRIYQQISKLKHNKNIIYKDNLKQATQISKQVTKQNYSCILSPAAASYGDFIDFKDRGLQYKKFIKD